MKPRAVAGLLALLLAAGCTNSAGCSRAGAPQSYRKAPDFSLETFSDSSRKVSLSEWTEKGSVLLIFWATWCPPCVQEIPDLNAIVGRFPETQLKVLAVNVGESAETLKSFTAQHAVSYEILRDSSGSVAEKYGVDGLPVAVLLAKGGGILYYGFTLPRIEDFLSQSS